VAGAPVGNQNARKAKIWTDAVKRAISRRANGDLSGGLDTLADKLVIAAESGEQWAMLELGNRLDGKPAQAIVGGDEDDNPIQVSGVIKLTKPGE
jgi:phage terminase large subunit-like protein